MIVNDDGVESTLTANLCEYLTKKDYKVYAILPLHNQSCMSGKIDINQNLKFTVVENGRIALAGSPVDCIHFGVQYFRMKGIKLDLILSGVNLGLNYGTTIFYSGTVAAALEANLYGINSIAVSIDEKSASTKINHVNLYELIEKAIIFVDANSLNCVTLNMNFMEIEAFDKISNILFENELIDKSFILPNLTIENDSIVLKTNISSANLIYGRNVFMCGLISRNYGVLIENDYYVWLDKFKKYIKTGIQNGGEHDYDNEQYK